MEDFRYAVVYMNSDAGKGSVDSKHNILLNEHLSWGRITACQHGNGRDWWIPVLSKFDSKIYTFLSDINGVRLYSAQAFNIDSLGDGFGRSVFSPNGEYFVTSKGITISGKKEVNVFKF